MNIRIYLCVCKYICMLSCVWKHNDLGGENVVREMSKRLWECRYNAHTCTYAVATRRVEVEKLASKYLPQNVSHKLIFVENRWGSNIRSYVCPNTDHCSLCLLYAIQTQICFIIHSFLGSAAAALCILSIV